MPAKQETENPGAFKLWISKGVMVRMAKNLAAVHDEFDSKKFIGQASRLEPLELKARVQLLRDLLRAELPQDFPQALEILLRSARKGGLSGFALWPFTEFIQTFGLEHRTRSLDALRELTELFTGEFAVRPFLKKDTEETLKYLKKCARSENVHVRRWASEGSRPRLPWGERLDIFIKHPEKTIEILELLKNDPELYVRKSVANHLNDISKDHPRLVVTLLKRWNKDASAENISHIHWITRHALRSLIKAGDPGALSAVGVSSKARVKVSNFAVDKEKYKIGDRIEIKFDVKSLASKNQNLVIDYVIHFMKSNQSTAPKVFKLKTCEIVNGGVLKIEKRHHLKLVTTRRFYPGAHALEIQINGVVHARAEWGLEVPSSFS